jgi:serine/threonine protein kinase
MGACTEPGNLLIVTEMMVRGSVYDLLHNDQVKLSFAQKMKIAKDAAMGMTWLHMSDPVFIHRDLKTGELDNNCFLSLQGTCLWTKIGRLRSVTLA